MADFTFTCDNPISVKKKYNTLVTKFDNAFEQRRSKRANPIHEFGLSFSNRTQSEKDAIEDFFDAKKGAYSSFTWAKPDDKLPPESWTEYTVRFKEDTLPYKRKMFNLYDITLTLLEVRT